MHIEDLLRWMGARGYPEPDLEPCVPAALPDHCLLWNYRSPARQGGAANLGPCPGESVFGVCLSVDEATLAALDAKEGHPHRYDRGSAPMRLQPLDGDAPIDAWVYVVTPEWRLDEPALPTAEYLALLVEGARRWQLPQAYIRTLRATATL